MRLYIIFFPDKIMVAAIAVDERMIFSNVSHIYKTMIALPFQSSLTMLSHARMAYKSAKKSAALSLKFLFWFLNLKVCYVSVIIVLVTHANLLVALPQKTILDMRQFCWQTSKLIEMDTKTMHAGSHREDKNQWGVKIKTHLNWLEKTAGWRIQLQMTSCVVCPIMDISAWSKSAMRK